MRSNLRYDIRRIAPWWAALSLLIALTACAQVEGPPGDTRGTLSGTLSYPPTSTGSGDPESSLVVEANGRIAVGSAEADADASSAADANTADFVPGEIIVGFREAPDGTEITPQATLQAAGVALSRVRVLSLPGTALYRTAAADRASTLAVIEALDARPDIAYAHPDYLMEPLKVPNDPLYPQMWHYPFVNVDLAWDITTGSPSVVVAVLDSGMLFGHPDAPANLLAGYDFVSDPRNLDGDGRDGDATDPGPNDQTAYHGTHVTGTVAARTNNAIGVAGVAANTTVLPVRVYGPLGRISDIADAIVWASGGTVQGVPDNPNAADVINLSLAARIRCSETPYMQNAIYEAVTRGAILVAAAGNSEENANVDTPAGCNDVVTVGAWNSENQRASYSNWGDVVDLMAPGDGVASLGYDDGTSSYGYFLSSGTSMAVPHVAGVIALMLAVEPELTRANILDALRQTATPYTSSQCAAGKDISTPATACGAGIVDARAAVEAALGVAPPSPGELAFSPASVSLGAEGSSATVSLGNTGAGSLNWQIVGADGSSENPAPIGDDVLQANPLGGTIPGGGNQTVAVQIDRSHVSTRGAYAVTFLFDTDGNVATIEAQLPVTFIVPEEAPPSPSGPTWVAAASTTDWTFIGGVQSADPVVNYTFQVTPGSAYVYAWTDEDGDGLISGGDWYGHHPTFKQVGPGESIANVDISLAYVEGPADVAARLPDGMTLQTIEQAR